MLSARTLGLAFILLMLCGCRSRPQSSSSPARLLFEEALTLRDTAAFARAVDDSIVFHAHGQASTLSRAQLWSIAQPILTAFPDIRFHVDDEVTSGNSLAVRLTFTGTHRAVWEGIPPTGRQVRVTEMFICHVRDERLSECWQEWDEYGLRRQLGAQ